MTSEDNNSKQMERIMEELRDIKLSQERLRAEFAAGFTPRDIHNLEMTNLREALSARQKKHDDDIARLERQREKDLDMAERQRKEDSEQAIGKNERLWLRVGSVVSILALLLALLEYLQHMPK